MPHRTISVVIDRPIPEVFSVLSDVEKTASWHPAGVEERWTSEPPVRVGSTRVAVEKVLGRHYENEAVVTVFEPNRALGMKSISGPVPFEVDIRLTPVGSGTKIDWETVMRPEGFYRVIVPMTFRFFIRQLESGLNELKQQMEEGAH